MKKDILACAVFVFCLGGCVNKSTKIPVYPNDDPRPKVHLKEAAKPYADMEYVMMYLDAYNHSEHDLQMTIVCNWYSKDNGNKMANDRTSVKVKSGTKKRAVLSGYYVSDGTRFFEIKCNVVEMEKVKQ